MKLFFCFKPLFMALATMLLIVGCSSPTFNIQVAMDKSMQTASGVYPSFEMDLVPVTHKDQLRLSGYSIDEYFQPGNSYRNNASKYTMKFSDEHQGPYTLKEDNPLWQEWLKRGEIQMFILANLPGVWKGKGGETDGRRLILPMDSDRWPNGRTIIIKVNPSGIVLESPLTPIGK